MPGAKDAVGSLAGHEVRETELRRPGKLAAANGI